MQAEARRRIAEREKAVCIHSSLFFLSPYIHFCSPICLLLFGCFIFLLQDAQERERNRIESNKRMMEERRKHEEIQLRLAREVLIFFCFAHFSITIYYFNNPQEKLRQKKFERDELARIRAKIAADKERRKVCLLV